MLKKMRNLLKRSSSKEVAKQKESHRNTYIQGTVGYGIGGIKDLQHPLFKDSRAGSTGPIGYALSGQRPFRYGAAVGISSLYNNSSSTDHSCNQNDSSSIADSGAGKGYV
ncbi:TPA: hypothetical protein NJY08_004879 [Salmonella enterica subsp. enterica serovar Typhi str. AG3]|nr:hypothetical protein [Salmonella enterica subsp. enterica serovar Typhi str. AG3]